MLDDGGASLLLDTCAAIWLANGDSMSTSAGSAIETASQVDAIFVSIATAWEIGFLSRRNMLAKRDPQFLPDAKAWFNHFLTGRGIRSTPFTAEIAIDASHLPGTFHADPADRMIVATARHLRVPIITRDRKIIDYARDGYVRVIPC